MSEKLLLVLMTAVLSGVSGWWGGRLGVRRALEQKKAERAFERRLDWYERAVRAISDHAAALHQLATGARNAFNEAAMSALVDKMISAQPALTVVICEAEMYATRNSVVLLAAFSRQNKLLLQAEQKDSADRSKGFLFDVSQIDEAAKLAFAVSGALAADVRTHIGLEALQNSLDVANGRPKNPLP